MLFNEYYRPIVAGQCIILLGKNSEDVVYQYVDQLNRIDTIKLKKR